MNRALLAALFGILLLNTGVTTLRCDRVPDFGVIIVQPGDIDDNDTFWDDLENLFD